MNGLDILNVHRLEKITKQRDGLNNKFSITRRAQFVGTLGHRMEICAHSTVDELLRGRRHAAATIQSLPHHEDDELRQSEEVNAQFYCKYRFVSIMC